MLRSSPTKAEGKTLLSEPLLGRSFLEHKTSLTQNGRTHLLCDRVQLHNAMLCANCQGPSVRTETEHLGRANSQNRLAFSHSQ